MLVTRFGRPLRADTGAGLHWKLPWPIDQAIWLDMRRRVYEGGHTEMLTRDKKNVIVRTFVVWRIGDSARVRAVHRRRRARRRGSSTACSPTPRSARSAGTTSRRSCRRTPEDLQVDQIESELLAGTAPAARQSYGVEIEQIRLERIALPEENVRAVFEQMRAERRQYAAKFRAEGEREASRIRSEAELEAARIRAEGAEQEARIRGESAAEVAKTYADAHRVDPELYRFTRSLDSLDQLVTGETTPDPAHRRRALLAAREPGRPK